MSAHRCGGGVGMLSAPGAHDWRGGIKARGATALPACAQPARRGHMAAKDGDNGELGNAGSCGVHFGVHAP